MNNVTLIGRMTSSIRPTLIPGKKHRVNFSLAVNNRFDKSKTYFFDCVYFSNDLTKILPYLTKGKQIAVHGYIETYKVENNLRYSIVCNELELLGGTAAVPEDPDNDLNLDGV